MTFDQTENALLNRATQKDLARWSSPYFHELELLV